MANSKVIQTWQIEEVNNGNMLMDVAYAIASKQWINGLSSYTQSHCSCSLTDDGYRIYRTPNKTYPGDGTIMWGGFVIDCGTNNRFGLEKGHTYVLEFDIKGQSSNYTHDIYWTWQIGWGGGELAPSPSNVSTANPFSVNDHQSSDYEHFSYKFTINDNVYKTCTANYNSNSAVAGNTYNSYRYFKYGWSYASTGSLGTDVYIKNLRMYDITGQTTEIDMSKSGIKCLEIIENVEPVQFNRNGGIECNELIEL